ncbi:ABC-type bacteriocin/lantibiotic exporters [Vibrio ponticus]|nr:ABC-type bacteriocin/lantibiotic exporters [Vibrio ponticus]
MLVKTKECFQRYQNECGVSCLKIIGDYYGLDISLNKINNICPVGLRGSTIYDLKLALIEIGLKADIKKKGMLALKKLSHPVILHWKSNHYVVLERIDKDFAYINDPELGRCKLSLDYFSTCYTGVCVEPLKNSGSTLSNCCGDFKIRSLLKNSNVKMSVCSYYLLLSLFLSVLAFSFVLTSRTSIAFFEVFMVYEDSILTFLIILFVFSVWFFIVFLWKVLDRFFVSSSTIKHSRATEEIISKITSSNNFTLKSIGLLRVCYYLSNLSFSFSKNKSAKFNLLLYLFIFLFSYISIFLISKEAFVFFSVILVFFITVITFSFSRAESNDFESGFNKLNYYNYRSDYINSISCKVVGRNAVDIFRLGLTYRKNIVPKDLNGFLKILSSVLSNFCSSTILSLSVFFSMWGVFYGDSGLAEVAFFILVFFISLLSMQKVAHEISNLINLNKKGRRENFLQYVDNTESTHRHINIRESVPYLISCESLVFSHIGEQFPLFENVNFKVGVRDSLAIVGDSGVGKSTLIDIILRKLEPKSGVLKYSNEVTLAKSIISVLPSDNIPPVSFSTFFFPEGSPDYSYLNFLFGCLELDRFSQFCSERTSQVKMYDLVLSKGAAHRFLIARALVLRPKVLIIDEAFTTLSPTQSSRIFSELQKLDCSFLIVTHQSSVTDLCKEQIKI